MAGKALLEKMLKELRLLLTMIVNILLKKRSPTHEQNEIYFISFDDDDDDDDDLSSKRLFCLYSRVLFLFSFLARLV